MLTTYVPLLCALVKPDPATKGKAKKPNSGLCPGHDYCISEKGFIFSPHNFSGKKSVWVRGRVTVWAFLFIALEAREETP